LASNVYIPRAVRTLRERFGLTQEKFAAKLGVTFPTVNRWENDRSRPSPLAMRQLGELARRIDDDGLVRCFVGRVGRDSLAYAKKSRRKAAKKKASKTAPRGRAKR